MKKQLKKSSKAKLKLPSIDQALLIANIVISSLCLWRVLKLEEKFDVFLYNLADGMSQFSNQIGVAIFQMQVILQWLVDILGGNGA